ncbi:MAG: glutathione S-transferase family protein [Pseudomonadota bacterium]
MLKLHGRPRSNYYNAVKVILLEKGLNFEEVIEPLPPRAEFLALSPMKKVPCLVTEHGPLTETGVIIDYLEETHPDTRMLPTDAFARAKSKEMMKSLELYIEWVARRGYGALRGETVSEESQAAIAADLGQAITALGPTLRFDPWLGGAEFGAADAMAYFMLIYARISAKTNADIDLLDALSAEAWFERVTQRESVSRTLADAADYAKATQG